MGGGRGGGLEPPPPAHKTTSTTPLGVRTREKSETHFEKYIFQLFLDLGLDTVKGLLKTFSWTD